MTRPHQCLCNPFSPPFQFEFWPVQVLEGCFDLAPAFNDSLMVVKVIDTQDVLSSPPIFWVFGLN